MKNYFIHFLLVASILSSGCTAVALAHETDESHVEILEAETVTAADLGVSDPGLLPTNPFYFLKEWGRGFRRVFTFNPVKKTELELKITNEKAAEVKKVEETRPEDSAAVAKALKNYQEAQERLKLKLESLKETSQNPNVDRLLEELAQRTVKHEKVFDELAKKFEDKKEVKDLARTLKDKVDEVVVVASEKDDPAKFAAKLERALVESKGGELKHVRSVEFIDRLHQKAPEGVRESLERLRRDFSTRLQKDLEEFTRKEGAEVLKEVIRELPGEADRRLIILEEVREKAEGRVADFIHRATRALEDVVVSERDFSQKAEEQVRRAEERVQKLEERLKETPQPPKVARNLLEEAKEHLRGAKEALANRKHGEAFGLARSAEVLARNGLRTLEEERPQAEDLQEELEELTAKINKYGEFLRSRGLTLESNPKAYALLEDARKHFGFARESFSKNDLAGTKLHIGHVLGYLHDLSRLVESEGRAEFKEELRRKPAPAASPASAVPTSVRPQPVGSREEIFCTQQYDPVCGENGKTYSNSCFAKVAGVGVKYQGECRIKEKPAVLDCGPQPVLPTPPEGCKYDGPYCKEGSWKYQLLCPPSQESTTKLEPATVAPAPTVTAAAEPTFQEFKLEADDFGFYPSSTLTVPRGSKVKLHFVVRTTNVYYGGLDFRSSKFRTESVKPGGSTSVEFTADEPFEFSSYWPASGVLKATGKVVVQ